MPCLVSGKCPKVVAVLWSRGDTFYRLFFLGSSVALTTTLGMLAAADSPMRAEAVSATGLERESEKTPPPMARHWRTAREALKVSCQVAFFFVALLILETAVPAGMIWDP